MKSSAKKVELASVDDLFSTEEGRQDAKLEKIQEIPLSELHPFKNHPFKVKDDEAMMETADSVRQYGVLVPAIARPDPEGGYELVAGHRRHRASELAEKETMPVIIRDLDDDAATIIMVDSNLQRESLLPSERAFAYKMKLEAMKRQAGRPSKNSAQVGRNFDGKESREILAEQVGQSRNQISRYIRLTELISELLDMVDERKIALNPAYELSFLKKEEQVQLLDAMEQKNSLMAELTALAGETAHTHHHHEDGCTCEACRHEHGHDEHRHDHGDEHCHDEAHAHGGNCCHSAEAHHHGEDCTCGTCRDGHGHNHAEHHHHSHEGHHHADEVFTSWGMESPRKFTEAEVAFCLTALDSGDYGAVLRAKGIVPAADGTWLHFDYVPGEQDIRTGAADYTGRLCVIGAQLNEAALKTLFGGEA